MIYQPRNVQPSSTAIDVAKENIFSMEIQTNSYISAYQLYILDFNNNIIYTGERNQLDFPIYNNEKLYIDLPADSGLQNGNNYKWRAKIYQPNADIVVTYGNVQNGSTETDVQIQININIRPNMILKIGAQSRTIVSYDTSTGIAIVDTPFDGAPDVGEQYYILSDFIETVPDYIIYARSTPEVRIDDVPVNLTLKYHTFNGVYIQDNNVPITYHQFDLYIVDENGNLVEVDSSGKVYSAKLQYTYDGFRTNNDYYIKLTIENDLGIVVSTELYPFHVGYEIIEYLQQPVAVLDEKNNAVKISWVTPVEHEASAVSLSGVETGFKYLYNTPYSPVNSLYTDGYIAEWNSEDGLCVMPEEFNITTQFSPDSDFYKDEDGRYTPIRAIIETETESSQMEDNFKLCLDTYNIVFMSPLIEDNKLIKTTIVSAPPTETDEFIHIYVKDDLDYMDYPYILFENEDYIAKIVDYDSINKKLTLQWRLPFEPVTGDNIIINTSLSQPLYTGVNEVFTLTLTGTPQINEDYIWKDSAVWDDTLIWTEGGTSMERVCNHWWKVQITNDSIRTEEIYPSAS